MMIMKKFYFKTDKVYRLCGMINSKNKDKIVVYAHGWTGSKESRTCKMLEKFGLPVFCFDFYGHGESEGKLQDMTISKGVDCVISAIKYVEKLGYKKIILLGSSFGGLCSSIAASKVKIDALILKSPVSVYTEQMLDNKGKDFIKTYKKFSAYKVANKIRCPVLIIHGVNDERVPIGQSRKITKIIKDCKIVEVEGLKHDYTITQLKQAVKYAIDFLAKTGI